MPASRFFMYIVLMYYLCFFVKDQLTIFMWIYCGSEGKASDCNAGDLGLIPGLGRSPGEGNGNPLQYSSLENPMD